ncbi:MAG TPA: hypothetical protein VGB59_02660 [Allosphingosinicella sp.]|jgi:hypothetical protein
MDYRRIDRRQGLADNVAAAWPRLEDALAARAAQAAEAPPPFAATPAAPDVPAAVGRLIVLSYIGLLAVFFALFARSPLALFSIGVCAVFVAVFFAVPRIFFAVEADPARRPSFDRFMRRGLDTATGRSSGKDALIQMLIVPVLLTLGLGAMGVMGLVYIP